MSFGKSLELYFVNGKPNEILTARIFNWTGHVLKAPRTQLKEALNRPEAQFAGVYLLLGEVGGAPHAYIGESECIADRIKQHDLNKDWWEDAVLITTTANELNKAHVRYLESRLIETAVKAKVAALDNGTQPSAPKLSEAATANMDEFLSVLDLVLPAIGVDLLVNKAVAWHSLPLGPMAAAPGFVLENKKHKIVAHARLVDGSFVVVKGSSARRNWEGKQSGLGVYQALHGKLVTDGVLNTDTDPAVFTTDYVFASPSAAAAVCHGRSANGRTEWRHEPSGVTYAAWEEEQLRVFG